ncbi:beta-N-acetylhexosaminidase [Paenibacillus agaridevorans]|uniref:beta-N-acetylhexosaminidase n=1 Tax=Paenibacillus agaridevorans TaxID=171404 RepID=UPI001BE44619|nr:beta-N-acetylhexosaminidase [Paenibacillus agaridevorans]
MSESEIKLQFAHAPALWQSGLAEVCDMLGIRQSSAGIPIFIELSLQNELFVHYDGERCIIRYHQANQLFRAVGLLVEALRSGAAFPIRETPCFDTIGAMIDCSRNAVLTVESVKELLRRMALMGMNTLMLYTEDTYTIADEPYFGYMRGKYSPEEISACDRYAASLGIELIPCIQTLAHLEAFLKWEAAAKYKDMHDVLLVGDEDVYRFIERQIKAAAEQFMSKRIHIGMDEAHHLGRGRSLDLYGPQDRFQQMSGHLSKVTEIVRSHGLTPMLWSDMFFRIGSETHDYYDLNSEVAPATIRQIPSEAKLVYWDYYHDDPAFYQTFVDKHKALGSMPVFAGGIWTWLGMCTHYTRTFRCSKAALSVCKEAGVKEVFITAWGDNGAENQMWSVLPGLQYYAEHAYAREWSQKKFQRRLAFCTDVPLEAYMLIEQLDDIQGVSIDPQDFSNPSKYLLWQDPLLGLFDKHVEGLDTFVHYDLLEKELMRRMQESEAARRMLEVPAKLCGVLKIKANLGIRLKEAYDSGNREELALIVNTDISELLVRLEQLRELHGEQWMSHYKPQGWEVIDLRYGGLLARLRSTQNRITRYLLNHIPAIDELKEDRLYFDDRVQRGSVTDYFTTYHRIASPNNVT